MISGLARYLELDELRDRMVLVICNMKPVNMRGMCVCALIRIQPLCFNWDSFEIIYSSFMCSGFTQG